MTQRATHDRARREALPRFMPVVPLPEPPTDLSADGDVELALAARHVPILRFDAREPFEPLLAGVTVFRQSGPSPSFRRDVTLPPSSAMAIEYAIWWDWDIGHLYELEHVWVYLDGPGRVVRVEASWHGDWHVMEVQGQPPLEDGRAVLYSQPGKHAFAPDPAWFDEVRAQGALRSETRELAGLGGVLAPRLFGGRIAKTPLADTLVRTYLQERAFDPAWEFTRRHVVARENLVPWAVLAEWIPRRVNGWLSRLEGELPREAYRFLRIGHRGASGHAPDNTLMGMRAAAELGADAVELDVQRTADGRLVLAHDVFVPSGDGHLVPVQGSCYEHLAQLDVGGGERIPMLEEALDLARELRLGLYLELKDGRAVAPLAKVLRGCNMAPYVIVGSFRPDWVAEVGGALPGLRTSVLFGSPHVDAVALARAVRAAYVHPCWERADERPSRLLTEEWLAEVRGAGLGILCWHEERPAEIAQLRARGVDGICSDRPELLLG